MSKTYEMFWDCSFCGTRKLLGKSHRFCASCGAPQDATKRYFPDESEKIAVEDHAYVGIDQICANCSTPSSALAQHCPTCGAALGDDDAAVALVNLGADTPLLGSSPETPPAQTAASRRSGRKTLFIVAGVIVLIVGIAFVFMWKKSANFVVAGHTWERSVSIESFAAAAASSWCDARPGDAYKVRSERRQRGTRNIPDGETCKTVNVDSGDGTYTQQQRCEPKYRKESVYDQWCSYTVDRWRHSRTLNKSGNSVDDTPAWPQVKVSNCARLGCTRAGNRQERYEVELQYEDGAKRCDLPMQQWAKMPVGSHWQADVAVITGNVDCSALQRQ